MKDNNIMFFSFWDKKMFVDVVKENGLYPEEVKPIKKKKILNKNGTIPNYERLKTIKQNQRKVTIEDVETGEIHDFPSIYKAVKFIKKCPQTIENWNGRVWNGKYKISV